MPMLGVPSNRRLTPHPFGLAPRTALPRPVLKADAFAPMLRLERRRAERSGHHFVLMLANVTTPDVDGPGPRNAELVASILTACTRETDVVGMYGGGVVGAILTEFGTEDMAASLTAIRTRVDLALRKEMPLRKVNQVHISFHVYPEDKDGKNVEWAADTKLYPDLAPVVQGLCSRMSKRALDVTGSICALIMLIPVLLCVALAVKLTSPGPVLFSQKRVGQGGKLFTFYKFRTMRHGAHHAVHEAFVKDFIAGGAKSQGSETTYKISNDTRVTPLGRVLRFYSIDELPQFYNVLRGDMSLVGPRPPLAYELEMYSPWHRRRLLEAKPGITGLWQVTGRSKTRFDEMVRLDLEYADKKSVAFDLVLLARTVWTVVSGDGAY